MVSFCQLGISTSISFFSEKGQTKNEDKFKELKNAVQEGIHAIRKKQHERDEKVKKAGPSADTVRMTGDIKDKITEVQKQIGQMNEELRKQQRDKKVATHVRKWN